MSLNDQLLLEMEHLERLKKLRQMIQGLVESNHRDRLERKQEREEDRREIIEIMNKDKLERKQERDQYRQEMIEIFDRDKIERRQEMIEIMNSSKQEIIEIINNDRQERKQERKKDIEEIKQILKANKKEIRKEFDEMDRRVHEEKQLIQNCKNKEENENKNAEEGLEEIENINKMNIEETKEIEVSKHNYANENKTEIENLKEDEDVIKELCKEKTGDVPEKLYKKEDAYKEEIKRLSIELGKLKKENKVINKVIRKTYKQRKYKYDELLIRKELERLKEDTEKEFIGGTKDEFIKSRYREERKRQNKNQIKHDTEININKSVLKFSEGYENVEHKLKMQIREENYLEQNSAITISELNIEERKYVSNDAKNLVQEMTIRKLTKRNKISMIAEDRGKRRIYHTENVNLRALCMEIKRVNEKRRFIHLGPFRVKNLSIKKYKEVCKTTSITNIPYINEKL